MIWPFRRKRRTVEMSVDDARSLLRGGVRFVPEDWLALDDGTREALRAAGEALAAEDALMVAACLQGPDGIGAVSTYVDGGHEYSLARMDAALKRGINRRMGATG